MTTGATVSSVAKQSAEQLRRAFGRALRGGDVSGAELLLGEAGDLREKEALAPAVGRLPAGRIVNLKSTVVHTAVCCSVSIP